MPDQKRKILKNVLINTEDNDLKWVDLVFTDKIETIIPKSSRTIQWSEIVALEAWEKFKLSAPPQETSTEAEKVYDGGFLLLMPGAIDAHVHFNTPGFEDREDFEHGSLAAACGGVTTVIDMPCTSKPPVTSIKNLKTKMQALQGRSWVDYAFWGGISGNDFESLDETTMFRRIYDLKQRGVVGFKAYLISGMSSFAELGIFDLCDAARMVQHNGSILAVHAEDKLSVIQRQIDFQDKGLNDWQAYCQARDDIAEGKAVTQLINIAKLTGCKIHIVHLSSKLALEQIMIAQNEGLGITAETCPHYLYFTENDFQNEAIANYLKTAPPVKKADDREALWQGLKDGTISFVTTDHAGCNPIKEKSSWNFWEVYSGIPGVEHRVPFLFSEGFKKGRLTLSQTIDLLSTQVAEFFGLEAKGSLELESDADFALINLWNSQLVKSEIMHSKGKYTPFEGVMFDAMVEASFVRGELVIDRNGHSEVKPGHGRPVLVKS